ncbi:hypothetical protein HDU97_005255 [Phlyctochytrium planicorne]|nr:hypothetical protein HDU97_005255 [Phlyctochytrium planicorne]
MQSRCYSSVSEQLVKEEVQKEVRVAKDAKADLPKKDAEAAKEVKPPTAKVESEAVPVVEKQKQASKPESGNRAEVKTGDAESKQAEVKTEEAEKKQAPLSSKEDAGKKSGKERKEGKEERGVKEAKESKKGKTEKAAVPAKESSKAGKPAAAASAGSDSVEEGEVFESEIARNRLEEHYYDNLLEDVMILRYRHDSPRAPTLQKVDALIEERAKAYEKSLEVDQPLSKDVNVRSDLLRVFSVPLEKLPTDPLNSDASMIVTNLLSKQSQSRSPKVRNLRRLWRRRLVNPIDYTTVRRTAMEAFLLDIDNINKSNAARKSFSPMPLDLPAVRKVVIKIWEDSAVANKQILLGAILSLQSITGVHAQPLFAAKSDAAKKIRAGMPIGAVVELSGSRAFEFLDKLIQIVLPRLREWDGVDPFLVDFESGIAGGPKKPSKNPRDLPIHPGTITLKLPESVMGSFPDIEPHYEMYPRLFPATVTIHTTAADLEGAALLLSGFQMPFLKDAKPAAKKVYVEDDSDPYAKFKKKNKKR